MNPEQLLDDLERWAREVQRCSAAARRARGKLKFARQQALGFMLQKELEVKALRKALEDAVEMIVAVQCNAATDREIDRIVQAGRALLEPQPESPKP